MKILLASGMLCLAVLLSGCGGGKKTEDTAAVDDHGEPAESHAADPTDDFPPSEPGEQQAEKEPEAASSTLARMKNMYENAKKTGSTTASDVTSWMSETYDGAAESGSDASAQTADWVSKMYNKAKNSGETSASSASAWVMGDLNKAGDWQYKVVKLGAVPPEEAEAELNKLGSGRWECYAVDNGTMYLKRPARSIIRSLPAKDLLKILPLLGVGGDDE